MKSFKLYIKHNNSTILLTKFNIFNSKDNINVIGSYNEKLDTAQNNQQTFTFSIAGYVDNYDVDTQIVYNEQNKWIKLLQIGAELILYYDNRRIDLVISNIAPAVTNKNIIYSYTASDILSYRWAKHNIGYSYSTTDHGGVKNIFEVATDILKENYINKWRVGYERNLKKETVKKLLRQKFTYEVSDSNLYNALVGACDVLGYSFKPDYEQKILNFYIKDDVGFSGYRLRLGTNVKSFSCSYSGDNFATIMHVTGGEDQYGNLITLVPGFPYAFQAYLSTKLAEDIEREKIDKERWYYNLEYNTDTCITPKEDGKPIQIIALDETDDSLTTFKPINLYKNWYLEILQDTYNQDADTIKKAFEEGWTDNNGFLPPSTWKGPKENGLNYMLSGSWDEIVECNNFVINATKNPTLNQFLFDFNFFRLNGQLSKSDYRDIITIMDKMRAYNTYLKLYTPTYHRVIYEVAKIMATLETHAEEYEALCLRLEDSKGETSYANDNSQLLTIMNNIKKLLLNGPLYDYLRLAYPEVKKIEKEWYNPTTGKFEESQIFYFSIWKDLLDKIKEYDNLYDKKTDELNLLTKNGGNIETLDFLDPKRLAYDQKKEELEADIELYKTLKNKWPNNVNPGKFSLMFGCLVKYYEEYKKNKNIQTNDNTQNISVIISHFEALNKSLLNDLYQKYDKYIYEATYSNEDELNSYGLYEQAINNFELIKKPAASYSLSIIDLNMLEEVDIPNIQLDAKIRVYEKKLNLNDNALNTIQYTDNELTITGISHTLCDPGSLSLTVEKKNTTNILLEKLLLSVRK